MTTKPAIPRLPPGERASSELLLGCLEKLGIETKTHRHPPVFTVEEAQRLRGDLPGAHCKSLFLKDKKGAMWLVVVLEHRQLDLKQLQGRIGSARLSFGRPERLSEALGVTPGAVTPFALINDSDRQVRVVLDVEMMSAPLLNYHPLTNTATTSITPEGLRVFLEATGHEPIMLRF